MGRELLQSEIERQAIACLDYMRRGGDMWRWLDSKSFTREDRIEIVRELTRRVEARKSKPVAARATGQEG